MFVLTADVIATRATATEMLLVKHICDNDI